MLFSHKPLGISTPRKPLGVLSNHFRLVSEATKQPVSSSSLVDGESPFSRAKEVPCKLPGGVRNSELLVSGSRDQNLIMLFLVPQRDGVDMTRAGISEKLSNESIEREELMLKR